MVLVLSGLQLGPSPPLDFVKGDVTGGLAIKEYIVSRAWPELSKLSAALSSASQTFFVVHIALNLFNFPEN